MTIGESAFFKCKNLKSFTFEKDSKLKTLEIGTQAFSDILIDDFIIPKSVEKLTIGESAFFKCKNLKSFTFEKDSKLKTLEIGTQAFRNTLIDDFIIPKSVEKLTIGQEAFGSWLSSLKSFTFEADSNLTELELERRAFNGSKLENFTVPKGVKTLTIEREAFSDCKNLTSFEFEEGSQLTTLEIENRAFNGSKLENFKVPKGVTTLKIGKCAFDLCYNIHSFEFEKDSQLTSLKIEKYAFNGSKLENFKVPKGVTTLKIEHGAFNACDNLHSFEFEKDSQLTNLEIEKSAFMYCNRLENFTVPKGVTTLKIRHEAFNLCKSLTSFKLEKGSSQLTALEIEEEAFRYCSKLEKFTVSKGVTTLKIGKCAFNNCKSLTSFEFEEDSQLTNVEIEKYAFKDCSELKEFKVPKFFPKLTSINVPDEYKEKFHGPKDANV